LSARESFCARVNDLGFTTVVGAAAGRLPAPENVSLEGSPKLCGWAEGAGLHESLVVHGGGDTAGGVMHGDADVYAWAS
jgi:hypothetical protein